MNKGILALVSMMLVLTGCAVQPQLPVNLDRATFMGSNQRIGVAMDEMPEPTLALPGASCILCMAAAAAANSSLSEHVKSLDTNDLASLDEGVADLLKRQGKDVVLLPQSLDIDELPKFKSDQPNTTKRDFSSLAQEHGIDQLLVIDVNAIGAIRPYSSYVPTGDPQAWIVGVSYLVDVKTNTYQWYQPLTVKKSAEGEWKEPPTFPGLTNAYYQLVEETRDTIYGPLSTTEMSSADRY